MHENHEVRIVQLMDELLQRLAFDIKNQPPQHLPHIAQAVVHLNAFKVGAVKGDEKHLYEITLLKNINQQVKGFNQGGNQDGRNESGRSEVQS